MYFIYYENRKYISGLSSDGYITLSSLNRALSFSSIEEAKNSIAIGLANDMPWAKCSEIVFIHPLNSVRVCSGSFGKLDTCRCSACIKSLYKCSKCGVLFLIDALGIFPEHSLPE